MPHSCMAKTCMLSAIASSKWWSQVLPLPCAKHNDHLLCTKPAAAALGFFLGTIPLAGTMHVKFYFFAGKRCPKLLHADWAMVCWGSLQDAQRSYRCCMRCTKDLATWQIMPSPAGVANQTLPNAHFKLKLLQSLCQLTHRYM